MWNDFCAQIIQKGLILEVSAIFLSHEAQTKVELATLGQEIKKLRSDLKEYHVNAVAIISRTFHPDQQGRLKLTRFCIYCHKNGHTLNWCRKKMRDEEVRKTRTDMSSERNISTIKNSSTEQFNQNDYQKLTPWTIFLNWMIEAAHQSNGYLPRKQIGNMKMNSLLLPNEDSFQGTMGWASIWQKLHHSANLTVNRPTHSLWATEVSKISFIFSFFTPFKHFVI